MLEDGKNVRSPSAVSSAPSHSQRDSHRVQLSSRNRVQRWWGGNPVPRNFLGHLLTQDLNFSVILAELAPGQGEKITSDEV